MVLLWSSSYPWTKYFASFIGVTSTVIHGSELRRVSDLRLNNTLFLFWNSWFFICFTTLIGEQSMRLKRGLFFFYFWRLVLKSAKFYSGACFSCSVFKLVIQLSPVFHWKNQLYLVSLKRNFILRFFPFSLIFNYLTTRYFMLFHCICHDRVYSALWVCRLIFHEF